MREREEEESLEAAVETAWSGGRGGERDRGPQGMSSKKRAERSEKSPVQRRGPRCRRRAVARRCITASRRVTAAVLTDDARFDRLSARSLPRFPPCAPSESVPCSENPYIEVSRTRRTLDLKMHTVLTKQSTLFLEHESGSDYPSSRTGRASRGSQSRRQDAGVSDTWDTAEVVQQLVQRTTSAQRALQSPNPDSTGRTSSETWLVSRRRAHAARCPGVQYSQNR